MTDQRYSGQDYWDDYHCADLGKDPYRDAQQRQWLHCFIPILQQERVHAVLDLGCGSGYDALVLAGLGFRVYAADISGVAIDHARAAAAAAGMDIKYLEHDIARPLPYHNDQFDAVICNLTLHMFPAELAVGIVDEVSRCLAPGGLFMFHVNATDDLPYRSRLQPPVVQLDNGMFCLGSGQTMRFFSEAACRGLVAGLILQRLEAVRMLRPDGQVQKCAWRCVARKPGRGANFTSRKELVDDSATGQGGG